MLFPTDSTDSVSLASKDTRILVEVSRPPTPGVQHLGLPGARVHGQLATGNLLGSTCTASGQTTSSNEMVHRDRSNVATTMETRPPHFALCERVHGQLGTGNLLRATCSVSLLPHRDRSNVATTIETRRPHLALCARVHGQLGTGNLLRATCTVNGQPYFFARTHTYIGQPLLVDAPSQGIMLG